MSLQLISRSPDLLRLQEEGYELEIRANHLLVTSVPYLASSKEIKRGTLVFVLTTAGDVAQRPRDHTAMFIGEHPHEADGTPFRQVIESGRRAVAPGIDVDFKFSSKPLSGAYEDNYEKVTTYAAILEAAAQTIDPTATAKTSKPVEPRADESVFNYIDTASARVGISAIAERLAIAKVVIVGLGGTGSYVLDLVAKCPVKEIHVFDGDDFLSHNAFRSPGAPSIEELRALPKKVDYLSAIYSKMHRHIVPHSYHIDGDNIGELQDASFVFLCLDSGTQKAAIVKHLESWGIPFVDVGMGVEMSDDKLLGILRVTTSTNEMRQHVWDKQRIPFNDPGEDNEYDSNIQIAELNSLNAALAVLKWKKLFGFYLDLDHEHFSTFITSDSSLINEDAPDGPA